MRYLYGPSWKRLIFDNDWVHTGDTKSVRPSQRGSLPAMETNTNGIATSIFGGDAPQDHRQRDLSHDSTSNSRPAMETNIQGIATSIGQSIFGGDAPQDLSRISTSNSRPAMETNIKGVTTSIGQSIFGGDAPQDHRQEPLQPKSSHSLGSLQNAMKNLVQLTSTITSQAENIKSAARNVASFQPLPMTAICSLDEEVKKLANIASSVNTTIDALNEARARSVIMGLKSLGSEAMTSTVEELLLHFDDKIREIIREILVGTNDQSILWRTAEECYKQAASPFGILRGDEYFYPIEESRSECPELFHIFRAIAEERDPGENIHRRSWINFWVRVLSKIPAGPTLFYPPISSFAQSQSFESFQAVPQYLFRTFDEDNSGRDGESVVASTASIVGPQKYSRIDLLAFERHEAAGLLYQHLTKRCSGRERSNNLTSWTSSLLVAIQYALWSLQYRKCRPSDIKICVVDTNKFPPGQFARDTWLINACKSKVNARESNTGQEDPTEEFFKFRLRQEGFCHGEFLSQGAVNHTNRSCVVSLEHLIQAGLFQLYPEFKDARGGQKWTERVIELRRNWSGEKGTTDQEIDLAVKIGSECFSRFAAFDMASIVLAFKNRRYGETARIRKDEKNGQTSQSKSIDTGWLLK
ncbi:hypothetical protein BU24DRAFT_403624 [Aaosphaeria arxii CBS 175.79]|uniref:DUF7587 domain-containing protein n=1 Tax=Aaosphaeria arxii CBS 175.79 TaxID=1450172 RepID=A0A6A5Y6U1_9PLEO|nr:uncharacterized protein BU24DRAFT_403624 [Aaosphaeria arxii CBS 175.79]KAF2020520.1 hypothetical protein BU24DRAFT_403624 [Aaosphaeria arxii CBS 175.79]